MQLGFFTANFTEKSLEEVIQIIEPYGITGDSGI